MATQAQVSSTLRLKITFGIGVPVPPNTYANYLTVDDISDWASILSGGQTIKTLYHIQTQVSTTVYKSAGYDTDDFTNPEYPTNDPLAQKQLPTAASGDPVEGVYTVTVKIKFDDGAAPFVVTVVISSQSLCITDEPTCKLELTYSCTAATFTSTDTTNYGNSKYTLVSTVRAHTVYPPDISGQSSVTVDSPTNTVNNLWSDVNYEAKLIATVTYKKIVDGNESWFIFYITATADKDVNCDDALCTLYCLLKKIRDEYYSYIGKNPTKSNEIFQRWLLGWHEYFMAAQARVCSPTQVEVHVAKFYVVTNIDPDCECGCDPGTTGAAAAPVVPSTPGQGATGAAGTDGRTPQFRLSGTLFQWKYTDQDASQWVTIVDLAVIVPIPAWNYELAENERINQASSAAAKSGREVLHTETFNMQSGTIALNTTKSYFNVSGTFTFTTNKATENKFVFLFINGVAIAAAGMGSTVGISNPTVEFDVRITRTAAGTASRVIKIETSENGVVYTIHGTMSLTWANDIIFSWEARLLDAASDDTEIVFDQWKLEKFKKL